VPQVVQPDAATQSLQSPVATDGSASVAAWVSRPLRQIHKCVVGHASASRSHSAGDENQIGNLPMCADPMGLQWMMDIMAKKPKPANTAPGLIYMPCVATQHGNTDPFDRTLFGLTMPNVAACPTRLRDAGACVRWRSLICLCNMPLHICAAAWIGNEYGPREA
jgi:hypothetical protein